VFGSASSSIAAIAGTQVSAEADGVSVDELTDRLLDLVPVP
jgi:hypothetical protein